MKNSQLVFLIAALPCASASAQNVQWQEFGYEWAAVDLSVDVDGDGRADVIIGDKLAGIGGEVTVRSGVDGSIVHTITGPANADYGIEVVGISDLNGDGFDEFGYSTALGGIQAIDGATGINLSGYTATPSETRLASIGDVNGDGWVDVVASHPGSVWGAVFLVSGRFLATGQQPSFIWTLAGTHVGGRLGEAITSISDVDGDGIDDVVVGAPYESGVSGLFAYHGQIHCLSGATGNSIWVTRYFATETTRFGASLAAGGDFNGDGVQDVLAGAPWNDSGALNAGAAFVLSGVHGGFLKQLYHDVPGDLLGSGVADAGDVDHDGTPDLLIGAEGYSGSLGSARLHSGASMNLITQYPGVGFQGARGTLFGGVDATGDGLPDFVLASPGGGFGDGRVQLWRGPCSGGHLSYCASMPNSTGQGANLHVFGTVSISDNAMTLEAVHCPPQQPGIFFYGDLPIQTPFGDGFRCVGGDIYRLDPPVTAAGSGFAFLTVDFTALPLGVGSGAVLAGDTRYFQFWYRDPAGPGGSGFNLTNGQQITFCP